MPPRALIEPLIGSALSSLTHSCPGISTPHACASSPCMAGTATSGDSMMPPLARVAANTCAR